MNSFKSGAGADYVHRQLVLEVWGFNQREKGGLPEAASHEEGNLYSLEDLEAAGMAAKAAAIMNFPGLSGTNGRFI
ncbi:MAG: hypothetical protein HFG76_13495 [Hungatella sp.]|nr:hypothetical protein [Hungatella sp.]